MNQELLRSNQDLKQFAFAASHDLQEPLRTISTLTELIQRELKDKLTERQNTYFGRVLAGTARMRALVRDLLAYSQVGREGRPPETVSIEKAVSAAARQSARAPGRSRM